MARHSIIFLLKRVFFLPNREEKTFMNAKQNKAVLLLLLINERALRKYVCTYVSNCPHFPPSISLDGTIRRDDDDNDDGKDEATHILEILSMYKVAILLLLSSYEGK